MREKPGLKVGPFQFSLKQFNMSFVDKHLDLTKLHWKILLWSRKGISGRNEEEKSWGSGVC